MPIPSYVGSESKGKSLHEFCTENGRDELPRQGDTEKNGGKTPSDVSMGSHQKVWWKCAKGRSYCASVSSRAGFGGDRPGGYPPAMPERNTL